MSTSVGFLDASGDPQAPLEPWQQLSPCGMYVKCLPCNKVIDAAHLETPNHERRLQEWQRWQDHLQSDYPEPAAPHLAYVPHDEDVLGQRWMKCLLCNKWVHDEQLHEDSKLHRKNLRNYPPSDTWYQENVVRVKAKYHPKASVPTAQPEQTASASSAHPALPPRAHSAQTPMRPPGMPQMMPPPTPQPEPKRPRVRRRVELSLPPRGQDASQSACNDWVCNTAHILADLTPNQARIACEGLTTQVVLATVETPLAATALSYLVERALNATLTSAAGEPIPTQSFYDLLNILADDYLLTNERI